MAVKPPPWVNRCLFNSPEMDLIAYFPKGSRVYCYSYVFKVVPCSVLHVLYDFSAVIAIRRMNGVSLRLSIRQAFDPERTRVASLDFWQERPHLRDEWIVFIKMLWEKRENL